MPQLVALSKLITFQIQVQEEDETDFSWGLVFEPQRYSPAEGSLVDTACEAGLQPINDDPLESFLIE